MISLKLNEDGQFEFDGQNNIVMVSGDDDLMQSIRHIITTNLGEWFLNPLIGWARFEALGQKASDEELNAGLTTAVLDAVPEVSSLEDFVFDRSDTGNRKVKVTFNISKFVDESITQMEVAI